MLQKFEVNRLLQKGVKDGLFKHAIAGFTFKQLGSLRAYVSVAENSTQQGGGSKKVDESTIFDIASITKFFLTMLFHRLCKFDYPACIPDSVLETPVMQFLRIGGAHSKELKVWHLLNFHAEFRLGHPTQDVALEKGVEHMLHELTHGGFKDGTVGEVFKYSNAHSILLGLMLEKKYEVSLEELFRRHIIMSLKMKNTSLNPARALDRCIQSEQGVPIGSINDPTARLAYAEGRFFGSAGIFSTAHDILNLLDVVIHGGVCNPRIEVGSHAKMQYLHAETASTLHIGKTPIFGNGVGKWDVFRKNLESYTPAVETGIHKLGHTGCMVAAFPEHGVAFTVLTDFLNIPRTMEELKTARHKLYILFAEMGRCAVESV